MAKISINLSAAEEGLIGELVASGRFRDAQEAIHSGLTLLRDQQAGLADVQLGLREGLTEIAAGQTLNGAEAIRQAYEEALERFQGRPRGSAEADRP